MTITNDAAVYYDPYDLAIAANPWPTYARLREDAPIYYNERYRFWAISRHSDVEAAVADWETFSNSRSDILELVNSEFDMPKGVMMFEDPPVHTMLRGLMSRVFTPRRMAEIEDQIRQFCVNCLDPHVGSDGFDIVAELASMMPMRVIGMLLGIPESDQIAVRDANDANLRTKPGAPMKVAKADKIADGSIYADYVEWRSHNPSDDLMTVLLTMEFDRRERCHPQAAPQGDPALRPGRRRRGQRDHRQADRLAGQGTRRAPRPAARGLPGSLAADPRGRRDAAVRTDRSACRPLHAAGLRDLRHDGARGQRSAAAVRRGQPRSAALHRTRMTSTSTATTSAT